MSILMKDSGVEWIGKIPENWKIARIKDEIESLNPIRIPLSASDRGLMEKNYDYYGASGIIDKVEEYLFDGTYLLIAEDGANLISRSSPLAFLAHGKFWVNNHAHILKPYWRDIRYYTYQLENIDYSLSVTGAAQPKLTQENLGRINIVVPSKTEQKQIADFLDKATLQIDDAIKTKEKQLKTLEALKKSIIHKAVTKGLEDSVAMIDSKIEWIGDIPKHWDVKMIKRFAEVKRGASPRPIADQKYFDVDGEFAWVRIADVTASGRYLENTTQRLSELGSQYSVKQYPNDLFISIAGTVGKPIISKIKCCIHDGFVWFDNPTFNKEYLYYIFYAGLPYGGLGKLGTQLNLNTDTIGKIYIPVIPNNELPKIVEYLDTEVEKINTLKENVKKQIEKLKEYKKSLIYEYVTGKKQIKG